MSDYPYDDDIDEVDAQALAPPGLVRRNLEEQAIWTNRDYNSIDRNDPRVRAVVARRGR